MPYDALKSFTPIARIAESPLCVVVQAESPIQSIADVISIGRAKPGTLNYGSGGTASTSQFAGKLLRVMDKLQGAIVGAMGSPDKALV